MALVAIKERWNGLIGGTGETGFGWSSTAEDVTANLDLSGQRILVTGCNSGLGLETMRVLALRGATVLGTARSRSKAEKACESVDGNTVPMVCDLAKPSTILDLTDDVKSRGDQLDAIVANAGVMALPELEQVHGYEKQFFVNYVSHYLLVKELLDVLDSNGRIVLLSSEAHRNAPSEGISFDNLSGENGYNPWVAYGQSKLAMLLFARKLARQFRSDDTNRTAYGVHPGVIHTNLTRNLGTVVETAMSVFNVLFLKSIPQGAATQTFAAVHPEATRYNGEYLADCNPKQSSHNGRKKQLAERLWKETETIVEEFGH
ncbi:MAG: SDR family NAD(P)-dependent oxidoreductase [bacterium]